VVHSINARISPDPVTTWYCGADDAYVWYEWSVEAGRNSWTW